MMYTTDELILTFFIGLVAGAIFALAFLFKIVKFFIRKFKK